MELKEEVVRDIVDTCKELSLEVSVDDIEELVESHHQELATEDLEELAEDQSWVLEGAIVRVGSGEEEEGEEQPAISTGDLKALLSYWNKVDDLVSKYHPSKGDAYAAVTLMNDTVMPFFNNMLKDRKKQVTLDRYFKRTAAEAKSDDPHLDPNGIKRLQISEKTPPSALPTVIMVEDSPSFHRSLPASPEANTPDPLGDSSSN